MKEILIALAQQTKDIKELKELMKAKLKSQSELFNESSLSLLSFLEVITRLTPSEKDNTILKFLSNILNAIIPNLKKGGGRL